MRSVIALSCFWLCLFAVVRPAGAQDGGAGDIDFSVSSGDSGLGIELIQTTSPSTVPVELSPTAEDPAPVQPLVIEPVVTTPAPPRSSGRTVPVTNNSSGGGTSTPSRAPAVRATAPQAADPARLALARLNDQIVGSTIGDTSCGGLDFAVLCNVESVVDDLLNNSAPTLVTTTRTVVGPPAAPAPPAAPVAPTPPPPSQAEIAGTVNRARDAVSFPTFALETAPPGDVAAPLITQLETYLWVDASQWRTITATAEIPGVLTVTATARPVAMRWSGGESGPIDCPPPGVPWSPGSRSGCTMTYTTSSASRNHTLNLSVTWEVTYTCSAYCSGGTLPSETRTVSRPVRVAEIQAIVTAGG